MRRTSNMALRPAALLAPLLVAGALAVVPAAGPATARVGLQPPRVLTDWRAAPYGSFAESLALGQDGYLYASVTTWNKKGDANVGQIWRVSPTTGARTRFGPRIKIGMATLTGIAFDRDGNLFAGKASFGGPEHSAVFRIDAQRSTKVLTLPKDTFPNGLAFRGDYLYITDSAIGAIWRVRPGAPATLAVPWFRHRLLMPGNPETNKQNHGLGADGIAFKNGDLYAGGYDGAAIIRVAIEASGKAGKVTVVSKRTELKTVDGFAFDPAGDLLLVTNGPGSGRIELLKPGGALTVLSTRTRWLDYPTMPVVGATDATNGTVYVTNGSFNKGKPSILALEGVLQP